MNPFQAQYPLSPKKFQKKMIPSVGFFFIIVGAGFLVIPDLMVSLLLLALCTANIIFYMWFWKAYIQKYFYDASGNMITIRKGVFTSKEIHVQWSKIQDVYVDQDIVDKMLGLYDVHIASATSASGIEAHIDGLDAQTAEGLKQYLLGRLSTASAASTVATTVPVSPAVTQVQYTVPNHISSTEFPIRSAYILRTMVSTFGHALFVGLVFGYYLFAKLQVPFLATLIVLAVLNFVYNVIYFFIWKSTYRFEFMQEFIYLREGVFSQSERHMPYRTVQDVTVARSFTDKLFGLSSVVIENATSGLTNKVQIPGLTIADADKLTEILKNITLAQNTSQTGV